MCNIRPEDIYFPSGTWKYTGIENYEEMLPQIITIPWLSRKMEEVSWSSKCR